MAEANVDNSEEELRVTIELDLSGDQAALLGAGLSLFCGIMREQFTLTCTPDSWLTLGKLYRYTKLPREEIADLIDKMVVIIEQVCPDIGMGEPE